MTNSCCEHKYDRRTWCDDCTDDHAASCEHLAEQAIGA